MPNIVNLSDFHHGETVAFLVAAKNEDGTIITTPGSQTLSIDIGAVEGGSPSITHNSSPQVQLVSSAQGLWAITLTATDLSGLTEGEPYFYNIWSVLGSADPKLQVKGTLTLQKSTK